MKIHRVQKLRVTGTTRVEKNGKKTGQKHLRALLKQWLNSGVDVMTKTAERYRAQGRCIWCGKPCQGISILCEECTHKRRVRYLRKRSESICTQCGRPSRIGKAYCFECALKQSERYESKKERKDKDAGIF